MRSWYTVSLLKASWGNSLFPSVLHTHIPQIHRDLLECSWCSTGSAEPVGVKNNGDGTHTVHYTPAQDGPYTVSVKYAQQEVPLRSDPKPSPTHNNNHHHFSVVVRKIGRAHV